MSKEKGRAWPVLAWTLGVALALPVLYVLSTGPVYYVLLKYFPADEDQPWADAYFKPYEWLCDNTPLNDSLAAYTSWWVAGVIPHVK